MTTIRYHNQMQEEYDIPSIENIVELQNSDGYFLERLSQECIELQEYLQFRQTSGNAKTLLSLATDDFKQFFFQKSKQTDADLSEQLLELKYTMFGSDLEHALQEKLANIDHEFFGQILFWVCYTKDTKSKKHDEKLRGFLSTLKKMSFSLLDTVYLAEDALNLHKKQL